MEVNGNKICLVTNVLQNIFFCVQQKKENLFKKTSIKLTIYIIYIYTLLFYKGNHHDMQGLGPSITSIYRPVCLQA